MKATVERIFRLAAVMFGLISLPCQVLAGSALQDALYDDYGLDLFGYIEARQGWRLQDDVYQKAVSISEVRLQLDGGRDFGWGLLKVKGDLIADQVEGEGRGELREFSLGFSPLANMDVKLGRQALTWGTGDLLFINDLFPKDWKSFFIGRDDEYLKGPVDGLRMSFFFEPFNLDLVYLPLFNGSSYIDGERLSYWNSMLGRTAGRDFIFGDHERNRFFTDSTLAIRISKNIAGVEAALYGYKGYWSTPEGLEPLTAKLLYPELAVLGASVRGALWGGIANLEVGYYDSGDDASGGNPLIRNSEARFLVGFERELGRDFTGGFQYYLEWLQDYDAYRTSLPAAMAARDEFRHLLTVRLTRLLLQQNLRLSLFAYYSPSDRDVYLRPKAHYKLTDQWALEAGANFFHGAAAHTFFGQFADNTNAYGAVRLNF